MSEHVVYELLPMLDDPAFSCLQSVEEEPLIAGETMSSAFRPKETKTRAWQAPMLKDRWNRPKVVDLLPSQVNDYPTVGLLVPAFSARAVDALREFLIPNGEVLPLDCDTGEFVAFNVTSVMDVLNRDMSIVEWPAEVRLKKAEPIRAVQIKHYEFVQEKVELLSIFRIPESITDYFVTERFAERVWSCGLRGFNFRKIYPLPRPRTGGFAEMERRAKP